MRLSNEQESTVPAEQTELPTRSLTTSTVNILATAGLLVRICLCCTWTHAVM